VLVLEDKEGGIKGVMYAPIEVTVDKKAEESLGMRLSWPEGLVRVAALKDVGPIPTWNANHEEKPELKVYTNDVIVAVNGVGGDANQMMASLNDAGPKVLKIVHGPGYMPQPVSFEITLEKVNAAENMGAKISYEDGRQFVITALKDAGMIPTWNSKSGHPADLKVYVNDVIVSVNGVSGDTVKMMEEIKSVGPKVLKMVHGKDYVPNSFEITLEKKDAGETLGTSIFYPDSKRLIITAFKDAGLIPTWNSKNDRPELKVNLDDVIVSVNGISGDAQKMMEAMRLVDSIVLKLIHGPNYKPEPAVVVVDEHVDLVKMSEESAVVEEPTVQVAEEQAVDPIATSDPVATAIATAMSDHVPEDPQPEPFVLKQTEDIIPVLPDKTEEKAGESKTCGCIF
jgi:hypothetical protein